VEWGYEGKNLQKDSVVLRTKKGDRSVEVEFPGDPAAFSDFTVPVSPAFSDGHPVRSAAGIQEEFSGTWRDTKPTYSDREITSNFPKGPAASSVRRDLESELGVLPPEEATPQRDSSYLAALDQVKKLFRNGRYESALLEVDELLQLYPTDPKLHQMRGTLLDRTGQPELALRSWAEAIELDPTNQGLKKFVDRRRSIRAMSTRMPAAQTETQSQPQTQGTMPTEGVKQ
jgi:tetratricopeptide (TPR) repeat protein